MRIKTRDILKLLRRKHALDFFLTEVKNGRSQDVSHLRMDAWAMRISWANPRVTAYEIKVSRGDFLKDQKWTAYLPFCNYFYFVSPPGVISKEEVGPEAGLMHVSRTGTRLYTKKRAPYRDVAIPESLYRYILMYRVVPRTKQAEKVDSAEYWKEWLKRKRENQTLGRAVSRKIRKILREEVDKVQDRQRYLERTYADIRDFLAELGIDPARPISSWAVKDRVRKMREIVPPVLVMELKTVKREIDRVLERIIEIGCVGYDNKDISR